MPVAGCLFPVPVCLAFALVVLAAPVAAQAPSRDTLRIVFVGDINFARSLARNYLFTGRGAEVFAGVRERLRAADIAVGNLESILLERGLVADTNSSPVFAGPQALAIPLLQDAGFDVIGTANNHAWDFGLAGLLENLRHLDSAGVAYTGTGATLGDAWRPVVIRAKGWTVAFFSIAAIFNNPVTLSVVGSPAECCVAWADTNIAARRFAAVRDSVGADLVVAYVHAGMEYKPYPEPDVVVRFRALARAGADMVIGHHPHVPQGIEYLDGKPIVYSLGNLVFMQRQPWTNRGLWAEIEVFEGEPGTGNREPAREPESGNRMHAQQSRLPVHGSRAGCRLPVAGCRLSVLPLAVGYTPAFLTGADSAAVMTHVDSIARLISDRPRLPIRRPRRNVAPPAQPRTARPSH